MKSKLAFVILRIFFIQIRPRSLSFAMSFVSLQVLPIFFRSYFSTLHHVFFGLPTFCCPCGFHWNLWSFVCFLKVCPELFHLCVLIVVFSGCWLVFLHKSALLLVSGHLIQWMFLMHLFTKTWFKEREREREAIFEEFLDMMSVPSVSRLCCYMLTWPNLSRWEKMGRNKGITETGCRHCPWTLKASEGRLSIPPAFPFCNVIAMATSASVISLTLLLNVGPRSGRSIGAI